MSGTGMSHEPLPDLGGDEPDVDHGHDDHGDDADELGPVDVQAWGALVLGVAAGLVIVLCLVLTTSILG